jgi:hypothetical protein
MGELRAYFFNNMYLQGIHAGIQTQHCTVEMFNKYSENKDNQYTLLSSWAYHSKTTIVLNGGYASNLERIKTLLESPGNEYPWAYFNESEEALGGCITNVGIILPEEVYNYDGLHYNLEGLEHPSEYNIKLKRELSQCRLMN